MIKFADAEWKIMEVLWEKGPLSTMELVSILEESNGWARSTVITLLNRMTAKGGVYFKTADRSKIYHPTVARNQAELEETKSFINKVYGGNIGLMISNLMKNESLSQEEIEEIRRIISEG